MDEALSEIAKHLPFHSKIVAKLCNKRCMQFIRIYQVPKKIQEKWNDDRIDLFSSDIREIYLMCIYRYDSDTGYIISFDYQKLNRMKLISLNLQSETGLYVNTALVLEYIKNMKSLKKLVLHAYILRSEDLNNILKTLDLEYFDSGQSIFSIDALQHMNNIKVINEYHRSKHLEYVKKLTNVHVKNINIYNPHVFMNILSIPYKHLEKYNIKSLSIHFNADFNKFVDFFNKQHIHRLAIFYDEPVQNLERLLKFISIFNVCKLEISSPGAFNIPVDFIIKRKIQHLKLSEYNFNNYSNDELKLLRSNCCIHVSE